MKTLTATSRNVNLLTVTAAVLTAYGDCHGTALEMDRAYETRNLNFRAPAAVTRDEAVAIMEEAVPGGYNEFKAAPLKKLPANAQITIAREGSVCIYVKGPVSSSIDTLKADEKSYDSAADESRLWWD